MGRTPYPCERARSYTGSMLQFLSFIVIIAMILTLLPNEPPFMRQGSKRDSRYARIISECEEGRPGRNIHLILGFHDTGAVTILSRTQHANVLLLLLS